MRELGNNLAIRTFGYKNTHSGCLDNSSLGEDMSIIILAKSLMIMNEQVDSRIIGIFMH